MHKAKQLVRLVPPSPMETDPYQSIGGKHLFLSPEYKISALLCPEISKLLTTSDAGHGTNIETLFRPYSHFTANWNFYPSISIGPIVLFLVSLFFVQAFHLFPDQPGWQNGASQGNAGTEDQAA